MEIHKLNPLNSEVSEINQDFLNNVLHNSKKIINILEKETDIMQGDIFVFKAAETYLSKCIAKVTNSEVTHIAMVLSVPTNFENGKLVEMSPTGIKETQFRINKDNKDKNSFVIKGEEVYVLRLKTMLSPNSMLSTKPLQDAAEKYINEKDDYDFVLLMFLASILIYKELPHTSRTLEIAHIILDFVNPLLELLDDKDCNYQSQTCAQLIYQIFWDSGDEYRLNTKPLILKNLNDKSIRSSNSELISLCNLVADDNIKNKYNNKSLLKDLTIDKIEHFTKELYEELEKLDKDDKNSTVNFDAWNELAIVTKDFINKRENAFKKMYKDTPIPPMDVLFVTPEDILHNTENLEECGVMKIILY